MPKKKITGRPTVITDAVVSKLIASFQNGLTIRQACWQSGISHEAYYQRIKADQHFADTMARAQQLPSMTARTNITKAIKGGDTGASKWWLEKKTKQEVISQNEEQNIGGWQQLLLETIKTLEELIALRYRGILFLQREQLTQDSIRQPYGINRIDDLLSLPDDKLADYVQLEVYATGMDKANVRKELHHRQELTADLQKTKSVNA